MGTKFSSEIKFAINALNFFKNSLKFSQLTILKLQAKLKFPNILTCEIVNAEPGQVF